MRADGLERRLVRLDGLDGRELGACSPAARGLPSYPRTCWRNGWRQRCVLGSSRRHGSKDATVDVDGGVTLERLLRSRTGAYEITLIHTQIPEQG